MAESNILWEVGAWGLIILFIIIVTFGIFSPSKGWAAEITKNALGILKYLPTSPSKEIKHDETLPEIVKNTESAFIADISKNNDKGGCVLNVRSLEGLSDYKMEISYFQGTTVRIEKPSGKEGGIKIEPIKAVNENLRVCIVNPDAFENCYLNPSGEKRCDRQLYNDFDIMQVTKDQIIASSKTYSFIQGFMFKPDNNRTCFIPQNDRIKNEIRYMQQCDIFDTPITGLKLCQIMYKCFDSLRLNPAVPKIYCNEGRPEAIAQTQEYCEKVKECTARILRENNIDKVPKCVKEGIGTAHKVSFLP